MSAAIAFPPVVLRGFLMIRTVLPAPLFLSGLILAGCSQPAAPKQAEAVEQSAPVPGRTGPEAESRAEAVAVEEENELFHFAYGWPAVASAVEPVRSLLTDESTRFHNELSRSAEAAQNDAAASGYPYRPLSFMKKWEQVASTPRFLSLSATTYTYEGGAHGMTTYDTLVWDRETGQAMRPIDMFPSAAALDDALRPVFCEILDHQRAEKRQEPVRRDDSAFNACIDPSTNGALILGSSDGKAIDRIGILIPPYNAGPYAEGSYEVTLPVTPQIIAALKPEYRNGFAVAE
jgi:hypothetical protein